MSRILLADDSPHAQRMGEAILRDEGFEVVSVTDGETALKRLADVDPDVVVASVATPLRSGYQICEYIKATPRHRHARVVLTTGAFDSINEQEFHRVRADGVLKKPFEASVMLALVRPLIESALEARSGVVVEERPPEEGAVEAAFAAAASTIAAPEGVAPEPALPSEPVRVRVVAQDAAPAPAAIDPDRVRAAVAIALDGALPDLIDTLAEKVIIALGRPPK